jgi:hypothetical protein
MPNSGAKSLNTTCRGTAQKITRYNNYPFSSFESNIYGWCFSFDVRTAKFAAIIVLSVLGCVDPHIATGTKPRTHTKTANKPISVLPFVGKPYTNAASAV